MPRDLFLPFDATHSGIQLTWTKSSQTLRIGGWYDDFVGIQHTNLSLADFFKYLGITEKDCRKAFKEEK